MTKERCMRPGCMNSVRAPSGRRRRTSPSYINLCLPCNRGAYNMARSYHMSASTAKLLIGVTRKKFNREDSTC